MTTRARLTAAVIVAMVGATALGPRMLASPASTPRLDWLFDDLVDTTARVGQTLYVGGAFSHVLPRAGRLPSPFALSPASGAVVPSGLPPLDFVPGVIAGDGAGGTYLAGSRSGLPGPQTRLVHVLANGTRDANFQPPVGALQGRMVRAGAALVIAGSLDVGGGKRPLLALDATTGALQAWTPALPAGDTDAWDVATDGSRVFVVSGTAFGQSRYVTAFDVATGAAVWQTDVAANPGYTGSGRLLMAGGRVIVTLGRLFALDPATGTVDSGWGVGPAPASRVRAGRVWPHDLRGRRVHLVPGAAARAPGRRGRGDRRPAAVEPPGVRPG